MCVAGHWVNGGGSPIAMYCDWEIGARVRLSSILPLFCPPDVDFPLECRVPGELT